MSRRCVVNVGTGRYITGTMRLQAQVRANGACAMQSWTENTPERWPSHQRKPYAFKAYALKETAGFADTLLWCDSSMVLGSRPLADLFEKIETDGYWIARNGWTNYEWTADSAYPHLFPGVDLEDAREMNRKIPHVVATAFGLSMKHSVGRVFLAEYFRLASQTSAFCGPWTNGPAYHDNARQAPCGPPDVHGHRHDQTAASVLAHRLGMKLSDCPEWFSYFGGETDKTCLIAKGI